MHATFPSSDRLEARYAAGDEGPFLEPLPVVKRRFPWHLLALLLLTALAGVTRFVALDHPPVWGDEASTFRRVSGTYEEMLRTLERDPFGPLFYEIEWTVRQFHHLTPFWLRFVPALAGTLMVPAMYFLTRQLAGIRTAMVAALLTLCSAWLINYGRDAKMYMTFWLFVTLSAGCFFWWTRTRTWTAWLAWIAAGAAMMGLNPWGAVLLAFTPIWLLTARRVHWAMGVGLVVGLIVICAGTLGYFQLFNTWRDKAADTGRFIDISWVGDRNRGAGGMDLVQDSTAAFLYSFTFIEESDNNHAVPPQNVLVRSTVALAAIAALLALGALPWRSSDALGSRSSPEPWWRPTLWVGMWLIIPTYLFYCVSVDGPQSPLDWGWAAYDYVSHHAWLCAVQIVAATSLLAWRPRLGRACLWLLVGIAFAALIFAFAATYHAPTSEDLKWHRPIDALSRWVGILGDPRMLWPMLVLIPGVAIARSGRTYRRRISELCIALLIAGVVIVILQGVHVSGVLAMEQMRQAGVKPSSIWVPRYLGFIWPAVAITAATLLTRLPGWPLRWTAIGAICALNLFAAHRRVFDHTEPPLDRIYADIYAGGKDESPVRTYVQPSRLGGGPGAGSIYNLVGRYYLFHDRSDLQLSPDRVGDGSWGDYPEIHDFENLGVIANNVSRCPWVNRVVIWKPYYRNKSPKDQDIPLPDEPNDYLLGRLGDGWSRTSEEWFPIRYHWSWGELGMYRRREYARAAALPTTLPTQPAGR